MIVWLEEDGLLVEANVGLFHGRGADLFKDLLVCAGDELVLCEKLLEYHYMQETYSPPSIHSSRKKNFRLCLSMESPTKVPHM